MKIPVFFKSYKLEIPNYGYWDYSLIEDVMSEELWKPVRGFQFEFNYSNLPLGLDVAFAVIVVPARSHVDLVEKINEDIKHLSGVVIVLIGDEDGAFPTEKLRHPRMKVWLMLPHNGKKQNVDRFIPNGYPTGLRDYLRGRLINKDLGWFFSGQVTHKRRQLCVKGLENAQKKSGNTNILEKTPGFTRGIPQQEYWDNMLRAKVAPCPSGAIIPDSFRFYEALECATLPLADNKSPTGKGKNFWHLLFGEKELPFPIVNRWKDIVGTLNFHNDTFPKQINLASSWWQQKKREIAYNLRDDMMELLYAKEVETNFLRDNITVVIPTSYVKSHPGTAVIEETIRTVRERLPDSEIIITFDGIRDEQKDGDADYQEYIRKMLWICDHEYRNVLPVVFDKHTHQIGMARAVLPMVKTPLLLYVEHDAPLCETIPFENLARVILDGKANIIRLHHEALILAVHQHLMIDREPITIHDVPLVRTGQWSQRPHLTSVDFYRRVLLQELKPEAYGMIEDGIIGKPSMAVISRGQVGWNDWKLMIYAPEGDMKRSYHLDARGKESKFENKFSY